MTTNNEEYILKYTEKLYILESERGIFATYNPNNAKVFATKEEAQRWGVEETTKECFKVISRAEATTGYDAFVKKGEIHCQLPRADKELSRPYNGESPEQVLEWYIKRANDSKGNIRIRDLKTWPWLWDVFSYIHSTCFFCDGMVDMINKTFTFSINVEKGAQDFATFKRELDLIIPYITHKDKSGNPLIDIIDQSPGNRANQNYLVILPGGRYAIGPKTAWEVYRYERKTYECEGDLREVFGHMANIMFY